MVGYAQTFRGKKMFSSNSFGMMKQYETVALLDFYIGPENDLLDERTEAKTFFETVLNFENRAARRLSYFRPSSTLLIFLKVNYSEDYDTFEKELIKDDDFVIFQGYEKGPCEKEKMVGQIYQEDR